MYYITVRQKSKEKQITWLDLINDTLPSLFSSDGSFGTITRVVETIPEELLKTINVEKMIDTLRKFNKTHADLHEKDKNTLYRNFKIPKKTGGFRSIDAPNADLQNALRTLKDILENKFGVLYHTSAFAYVSGRSTVKEVKKHQNNESNWFLKTDFSGFFPSTTLDFTMRMLSMIFPLCEICKVPEGYSELKKALSLGFLNDSLPQGTVLSPYLTNAIMIPIDHKIFNDLAHKRYVYTRYADDIHISCIQTFSQEKMVQYIRNVLKEFDAPYIIKDEKTHYGSRKGRNWQLGLMLNAENNITVGHQKKKYFKAATTNLIMDYKHHRRWSLEDVQHYSGLLSYYKMVEPEYFENLITHFNQKFNVDVKRIIKDCLTNGSW